MPFEKGGGKLHVLAAIKRPLIRYGLERLIASALPGAKLLSASCGKDALTQFTEHKPALVVVDPEIAFEFRERFREACPATRLLVISATEHVGIERIPGLCCACGHLSDGASEDRLIESIRIAAVCGYANIRACGDAPCALKGTLSPIPTGLSTRQEEVFVLISEGLQPKEIARRLSISVKTVESYRGQIKQKFGLSDSRMLFQFAALWRRDSRSVPTKILDQRSESQLEVNDSAESGGSK